MKKLERVKLFTGGNVGKVEKAYNKWYDERIQEWADNTILSNIPFMIIDRKLAIRNYEGAETFALAIFYEHMELEPAERGSTDRAGHVNSASMFIPKK